MFDIHLIIVFISLCACPNKGQQQQKKAQQQDKPSKVTETEFLSSFFL